MIFDAATFSGPTIAGWPAGAGPLAVLGRPPRWLHHPTRRRQPDDSWSYAGIVRVEHRDQARADLDVLVRAGWLVTLRPAADDLLELRLDPPRPGDGAHPRTASQPKGRHRDH